MTISSQDRLQSPRSSARKANRASELDIVGVVNAFRRQWKVFVASVLLIALAVVFASSKLKRIYVAESRIQLDLATRPLVDANSAVREPTPDPSQIDTEVALMRARNGVEEVVRRFGLINDGEYRPAPAVARAITPDQLRNVVVDAVIKRLRVAREGTSYVVDLEVSSEDPANAARLANAFADRYLAAGVDTSIDSATRRSAWLDQRLRTLGGEVEAADAAVARYRAQAGIASGVQTQGTITDQQVAPLSSQLATAESESAAANSNLDAAHRQVAQGGLQSVSGVLTSTVIGDLRRQRAEVLREAADISTRYGPKHPETIKVQQQLAVLDRQLRDEAQRILSGLDADARAASARAQSLRAMLGRLKGQQADNTRSAVQADALQREADARRTIYDQLARAAQQTSQTDHLNEPKGRVIERAVPPLQPAFPKRALFAAFGVLLGALVGSALVLLLELLANGLRTVGDVEALGVPLLASVPQVGGGRLSLSGRPMAPWDYVVSHPLSAHAESFRTLRSVLTLGTARARSVVITSALPGEGKTSAALALARVMAMSGERVVLVDCDLRRGRSAPASALGGVVEVLSGRVDVQDVKRPDSVPGLDLIDGGKSASTPRDIFGGEGLPRLIQRLTAEYDHVILDAPPVLALADARTLAAAVDAVVLIARWRRTPGRAVAAALNRLEQDGSPIAGVVLLQVDTRAVAALDADDPARYARVVGDYYRG